MDKFVVKILNAIARDTDYITEFMFLIVNNDLLKGGVVITVLWYLWFNEKSTNSQTSEKTIITLFSSIIAITVGRSLNNFLPYKARPILNPEFDFPYQIDEFSWLNTWSSFPSDHAILFFSLATGIFIISKKWGTFSLAYVTFIICLPRIYLGFHYFTDILAGAAIGILIVLTIYNVKITKILSNRIIILSNKFPGLFYALSFILSYQIATLFNDSRKLIEAIIHFILG